MYIYIKENIGDNFAGMDNFALFINNDLNAIFFHIYSLFYTLTINKLETFVVKNKFTVEI